MQKPTRVCLEFYDHEWKLDRAWHAADEAIEDAKVGVGICCENGLLVAETEHSLTLSLTRNEHEIGPYFTVLKSCIIRRQDEPWPWSDSPKTE